MKTGTKYLLRLFAILLILCILPLGTFANAETGLGLAPATQEGTMTDSCKITLPEALQEKSYRITDRLVETYLIIPAGSEMTIEIPEAAQAVYLQWYALPASYVFEQYDGSGTVVSSDETQLFYNCYYPVSENTRSVKLTMESEMALSGVFVFGADSPIPTSVQQWAVTPEKTDVMIVAATTETALVEFGSVVARYTVEHSVPTSIVILSDGTRTAVEEYLSALWQMGVTDHPLFANFHCDNNAIYKTVNAQWKKKAVSKYLTNAISAYSPAIIVSHPASDAASLAAAQFTGEQLLAAAKKAKVSKVYQSDVSGGTVLPDDALISANGQTISESVRSAYTACCVSQLQFAPDITPNLSFTLQSTELSEDAGGNDLLENIDTASLSDYKEPEPTPEPTPEATPEPTPEPTAEPTAAPEAAPVETKSKLSIPLSVLTRILPTMGVGIVLTILSFLILHDRIYRKYRRRRRRRKGKRIARLVGFAPLMVAVVVSLVFLALGVQKEEVAISSPASVTEPAAEAEEPAPTEPEPEAVAEDTPSEAGADDALTAEATADTVSTREPSEADQYFRTASDPEEVILSDYDTGKWEYRTDTLSIQIDRRETTNSKGPVVYFVAHIRMRDVDSFRTTLSDADNKGDGLQKPWIVSRRAKAVLLVTGDNLVHMDTEFKSILIRRGRVYQDDAGDPTDTMAMLPDMTMQTYPRRTTTASELLQDGVREAFSFGPTLVRDSEVLTDLDTGRLRIINPRTGIGMIEPGHFVAIVVDGRQADYSVGMLLSEFAELFKAEGCTQAYNLDGGVSTCMIFMGEQVNHHGVRRVNKNQDDTYQRRIPDALIWGYSEQVPGEDDPVTYTGELPG